MRNKPFRLVSEVIPEQYLHEAVASLCNKFVAPPCVWAHYPAGSIKLAPPQAAKLVRMGLRSGFPDFIFFHDFKTFAIELKSAKGVLSRTRMIRTKQGALRIVEGQREVFAALEVAGMTIAICRSVDEVLQTLAQWAIPLRGQNPRQPAAGALPEHSSVAHPMRPQVFPGSGSAHE